MTIQPTVTGYYWARVRCNGSWNVVYYSAPDWSWWTHYSPPKRQKYSYAYHEVYMIGKDDPCRLGAFDGWVGPLVRPPLTKHNCLCSTPHE